MTARWTRPDATGPLVALALLAALPLGVLTAERLVLGIALLAAGIYALIALRRPAVGVALWMPAFFLTFVPPGNALLWVGFPVVGVAVVLGLRRGSPSLTALALHRALALRVALLLAWLALSLIWAREPGLVISEMFVWVLAVLVCAAIVATATTRESVMIVVGGLIAGAALSAVIGLFGDSVGIDAGSFAAASGTDGRAAGGSGDANQLAAGLVPAIALAVGLSMCVERRALRWLIRGVVPLAVVGIAASESRGGFIAAIALVVLLFVLFRGVRHVLVASTAVAVAAGALYFAADPGAWSRIHDLDSDGTGRVELWRVASHMTTDHPIGVGLNNFRAAAPDYALDVGSVEYVNLIVERPVVAHNTYLQLVAETGLVGLSLFVAVVAGSLWCALRAARILDATGDHRLAILARAAVAALGAFLVAAFFVSFGQDYRLWALLALGPAMLTVAERRVVATWT